MKYHFHLQSNMLVGDLGPIYIPPFYGYNEHFQNNAQIIIHLNPNSLHKVAICKKCWPMESFTPL